MSKNELEKRIEQYIDGLSEIQRSYDETSPNSVLQCHNSLLNLSGDLAMTAMTIADNHDKG